MWFQFTRYELGKREYKQAEAGRQTSENASLQQRELDHRKTDSPPYNLNFQAAGCSLLIISHPEPENTLVSFMSPFGGACAHTHTR